MIPIKQRLDEAIEDYQYLDIAELLKDTKAEIVRLEKEVQEWKRSFFDHGNVFD